MTRFRKLIPIVGAAVVVHQARQEVDLLVAPAVEAVQEISHGRYGNPRADEISG